MKKTIIFFILLFSVPLVSAALDETSMSGCYEFDNDATNALGNTSYDGRFSSPTSTPTYVSADSKSGGSYYFDGTNDRIVVDRYLITGGSHTFALWVKENTSSTYEHLLFVGNNSDGMTVRKTNGNALQQAGANDPTAWDWETKSDANNHADGTWHHIVATRDGSNLTLYNDGAPVASTDSTTATGDIYFTGNADEWRSIIGSPYTYAHVQGFEGRMDLMQVWDNRSLTEDEIISLYNSGSGRACSYFTAAPPQPNATMVLHSPSNNSHENNATIKYTYNVTSSDGNVNCSLFIDDSSVATSNLLSNGTKNFNHSTTAGTHTWNVQCTDPIGQNETGNFTIVVDRTNPILSLKTNHSFALDNTTYYEPFFSGNITYLNFTITDTYVWGWNATIANLSGDHFHTNQSENLTGVEENYTKALNISTWPVGQYNLSIQYSDDHTAHNWDEPINVTKDLAEAELGIDTGKGEHITIKLKSSDIPLLNIESERLVDRLRWDFFMNGSTATEHTYTFKLSTEYEHFYREDLYSYPVFVLPETGNWVDFNLNTSFPVAYDVKKVPSGGYEIDITTKEVDLRFSSIGGLNIVTTDIRFNISRTPRATENVSVVDFDETWIELQWDDYDERTWTTLSFSNGTIITNTTAETYNVSGLTINTTYTFLLTATYNESNNIIQNLTYIGQENNITTATYSGVPKMVESFSADLSAADWLYINWSIPAATKINGTELYRGAVLLLNVTNGTLSYNDTGLNASTSYTYRMKTYSAAGIYNQTINSDAISQFSKSTENNGTLSIEFRNESNNETITDRTVYVSMISDAQNQTGITSTGFVNIDNITAGNYTVRFFAEGYGLRELYYQLNASGGAGGGFGAQEVLEGNDTTTDWIAYLIGDNYRTGGVVSIRDTTGDKIDGAIVKLARFYLDCNCYRPVQMVTTDSKGEAGMDAEAYDGYYKFFVDYEGTNRFISTQPEVVYPESDGLWRRVFTLNLGTDYFESYQKLPNVGRSLTESFNSATNQTTHSFSWSDPSGIVTQGCYRAEYLDGVDFAVYTSTCSSGATGSIVVVLNNSGNTSYKYAAWLDTSTSYSEITVFSGWWDAYHTSRQLIDLTGGAFAAFLGTLLFTSLVLLFSYSATAITVVSVVGVVALSALKVMPFTTAFIMGLSVMVLGIVIYFQRS